MTGLQMPILMSIHVHSQKEKTKQPNQTNKKNNLKNQECFFVFFNRLFRHKNKTAFPVSDSIIKNINIVSVCFSLTSCEICEENGTETWTFSLTF